jgi:4a-hydroxytetrahydrobiopterin dehydratase
MATLLEPLLVEETLKALPGWEGDQERLWREFQVEGDAAAELRRQVAEDAAALGHEPQVEEVEGGLRYSLSTPEAGGVTELDVALASRISDVAHRLEPAEPGVDAVRSDEAEVVIEDSRAQELQTQPERVGKFQVRF